jgi:hypothetical protein
MPFKLLLVHAAAPQSMSPGLPLPHCLGSFPAGFGARQDDAIAAAATMTFFVNNRCIDCGTCWQWDPQHFAPAHARRWLSRAPHLPPGR